MSGFYKKFICFFLSLLFIFSLSVPALAASGSTTVYRTRTGACYHTSSCRYLSRSKIKTTLNAAVNTYHLRPCSVCKPPVLDKNSPSSRNGSSGGTQSSSSRPKNGKVLYSKYKTKPSTLTFKNDKDYDCCVFLLNSSGNKVLQFYVRKNKDATVKIPKGTFTFKIAYGSSWKNKSDLFGVNTHYYYDNDKIKVEKGDSWTYTFW